MYTAVRKAVFLFLHQARNALIPCGGLDGPVREWECSAPVCPPCQGEARARAWAGKEQGQKWQGQEHTLALAGPEAIGSWKGTEAKRQEGREALGHGRGPGKGGCRGTGEQMHRGTGAQRHRGTAAQGNL